MTAQQPEVEVITPEHNSFQMAFLASSADIVIGGGGANSGKTYGLLLDPLRYIEVPGYTALVTRRDEVDLEKPDSPWIKSFDLYPKFGGDPLIAERRWRFPAGTSISFSFIGKDYERQYQGTAFCGFLPDELTHYSRSAIRYMLGRNRSTCGIRPYMRGTCNPDPDSWVKELVDPWLHDVGDMRLPDPARRGMVRYFLGREGQWVWGDSRAELLQRFPRAKPGHIKSVTFIPGTLADNKYAGEEAEGNLLALEDHMMRRLLLGDWNARADGDGQIQAAWFQGKVVEEAPPGTRWYRVWDLAATPEARAESGSSFTAGPLIGQAPDNRIFLRDLVLGRWDEGDVQQEVVRTAALDGRAIPIWFCRERAGAGLSLLGVYVRLLQGYDVQGEPETGDKEVRLRPFAAQCKAGNVYLVREAADRPWHAKFIQHVTRPGRPDDVKDACAAGYARLVEGGVPLTARELVAVATQPGLVRPQGAAPRLGEPLRGDLGAGRYRL